MVSEGVAADAFRSENFAEFELEPRATLLRGLNAPKRDRLVEGVEWKIADTRRHQIQLPISERRLRSQYGDLQRGQTFGARVLFRGTH